MFVPARYDTEGWARSVAVPASALNDDMLISAGGRRHFTVLPSIAGRSTRLRSRRHVSTAAIRRWIGVRRRGRVWRRSRCHLLTRLGLVVPLFVAVFVLQSATPRRAFWYLMGPRCR